MTDFLLALAFQHTDHPQKATWRDFSEDADDDLLYTPPSPQTQKSPGRQKNGAILASPSTREKAEAYLKSYNEEENLSAKKIKLDRDLVDNTFQGNKFRYRPKKVVERMELAIIEEKKPKKPTKIIDLYTQSVLVDSRRSIQGNNNQSNKLSAFNDKRVSQLNQDIQDDLQKSVERKQPQKLPQEKLGGMRAKFQQKYEESQNKKNELKNDRRVLKTSVSSSVLQSHTDKKLQTARNKQVPLYQPIRISLSPDSRRNENDEFRHKSIMSAREGDGNHKKGNLGNKPEWSSTRKSLLSDGIFGPITRSGYFSPKIQYANREQIEQNCQDTHSVERLENKNQMKEKQYQALNDKLQRIKDKYQEPTETPKSETSRNGNQVNNIKSDQIHSQRALNSNSKNVYNSDRYGTFKTQVNQIDYLSLGSKEEVGLQSKSKQYQQVPWRPIRKIKTSISTKWLQNQIKTEKQKLNKNLEQLIAKISSPKAQIGTKPLPKQ